MDQIQTMSGRRYLIPLPWLVCATIVLAVGELVVGTAPIFIPLVSACVLLCGLTYNVFGGACTFAGIIFAQFALRTIVLSQVVKVAIAEPAEKYLEAPILTITVYVAFYASVLFGAYVWQHVLPSFRGAWEFEKISHLKMLYLVLLVAGLGSAVIQVVFESYMSGSGLGRVLKQSVQVSQGLMLLSCIVAVDIVVRESKGRHSVDWRLLVPAAYYLVGVATSGERKTAGIFLVVYVATCVLRQYHFRAKHYLSLCAAAIVMVTWVNPVCLYLKQVTYNKSMVERVKALGQIYEVPLAEMKKEGDKYLSNEEGMSRESYFENTHVAMLNRLALIRVDSNLISVCADGYHYGWTTMAIEAVLHTPYFLNRSKSAAHKDSSYFTGPLTGIDSGESEGSGEAVLSPIADAFGSFSWLGIFLFGAAGGSFLLTCASKIYDTSKVWGTLAAAGMMANAGEGSMGGFIFGMIRIFVMVFIMSVFFYWIVTHIPARGE